MTFQKSSTERHRKCMVFKPWNFRKLILLMDHSEANCVSATTTKYYTFFIISTTQTYNIFIDFIPSCSYYSKCRIKLGLSFQIEFLIKDHSEANCVSKQHILNYYYILYYNFFIISTTQTCNILIDFMTSCSYYSEHRIELGL